MMRSQNFSGCWLLSSMNGRENPLRPYDSSSLREVFVGEAGRLHRLST